METIQQDGMCQIERTQPMLALHLTHHPFCHQNLETTPPLETWNHAITSCTNKKYKLLNIDIPKKQFNFEKVRKTEKLKMKITLLRLFPNIASLKVDIA